MKNTRKLGSSGLIGPLSDPDLIVTVGRQLILRSLESMAGTTGLEPATSAVTGQRPKLPIQEKSNDNRVHD